MADHKYIDKEFSKNLWGRTKLINLKNQDRNLENVYVVEDTSTTPATYKFVKAGTEGAKLLKDTVRYSSVEDQTVIAGLLNRYTKPEVDAMLETISGKITRIYMPMGSATVDEINVLTYDQKKDGGVYNVTTKGEVYKYGTGSGETIPVSVGDNIVWIFDYDESGGQLTTGFWDKLANANLADLIELATFTDDSNVVFEVKESGAIKVYTTLKLSDIFTDNNVGNGLKVSGSGDSFKLDLSLTAGSGISITDGDNKDKVIASTLTAENLLSSDNAGKDIEITKTYYVKGDESKTEYKTYEEAKKAAGETGTVIERVKISSTYECDCSAADWDPDKYQYNE